MLRSTVRFEGLETTFVIDNPRDHIQDFHRRGEFYELRQLIVHRNLVQRRVTIIDVGANVGNHTLFYARHTGADRVYPIEAKPSAVAILKRMCWQTRKHTG